MISFNETSTNLIAGVSKVVFEVEIADLLVSNSAVRLLLNSQVVGLNVKLLSKFSVVGK